MGDDIITLDLNKPWPAQRKTMLDDYEEGSIARPRKKEFITILE